MPRRRRRNNDDPFAVLVEQLIGTPQVQSMLDGLQYQFDRFANAVDPKVQPPPPKREKKTRQKAPSAARPNQTEWARGVLHFGAEDALTKDEIKKRKKSLAAVCHPDRGGSAKAMADINRAADILLKEAK